VAMWVNRQLNLKAGHPSAAYPSLHLPHPRALPLSGSRCCPASWHDKTMTIVSTTKGLSLLQYVCIRIASSQRSYPSSRTSGPPELVPPGRVRRNNLRLENREVFVGTIAALCADNSPRNRSAIFSAAGLRDHQLAPLEAAWARKTPNIPWRTFSSVFGAYTYSERPMIRKDLALRPYMGSLLCANKVTQPFAPMRVGEPGVILFPPGAVLLEDTKETFHVLVDPSAQRRTKLRYCGVYTKVHTPDMEVQRHEWCALPTQVSNFSTSLSGPLNHSDVAQCRAEWLKRLWRWKVVDLHARCNLRKKCDSEPSLAEIREWLRKYHDNGSVALEKNTIPDAFNSGIEVCSLSRCRVPIAGLTAGSCTEIWFRSDQMCWI